MSTDKKAMGKDFFMHVGLMVALYASAVALLNILFRIINILYPKVDAYYRLSGSNISFPVATLIVFFPLFLVLANTLNKNYKKEPARKNYTVRHWLIYITLFLTGLLIAGDLVTLLYFFLDGQDLTTGFLLKVLSVGIVGGSVFGYFLDDVRNKLDDKRRLIWRLVAIVLVVGAIAGGFRVIGSPGTQRLMRQDAQRVMDLQNIQSQIIGYWQSKEALPENFEALKDPLSSYGFLPLTDPTGEEYKYRAIDEFSFELCATFSFASDSNAIESRVPYFEDGNNQNWQHGVGEECFARTIDPDRYSKFR